MVAQVLPRGPERPTRDGEIADGSVGTRRASAHRMGDVGKEREGRGAERRRSQRASVHGQVRLTDSEVDGFLLDASDAGVRAVLWTHHVVRESIVELVLSLSGRGYRRHARVRWARQYREGSVVGLELLSDQMTRDEDRMTVADVEVQDLRDIEEAPAADVLELSTDLPDEITSIEAHPLLRVGDPRSRDVVMSAFVRIGAVGDDAIV